MHYDPYRMSTSCNHEIATHTTMTATCIACLMCDATDLYMELVACYPSQPTYSSI